MLHPHSVSILSAVEKRNITYSYIYKRLRVANSLLHLIQPEVSPIACELLLLLGL